MLLQYGTLIPRMMYIKSRLCRGGRLDGSSVIIHHDWRTLEQWRADSRLVLFDKIIYGYVAAPLPSYIIPLTRVSRTSHPLAYRQIYARTDYYKYSFSPSPVVQWNSLPAPHSHPDKSRQLQVSCQSGIPPQTIISPPPFLSSLFFLEVYSHRMRASTVRRA